MSISEETYRRWLIAAYRYYWEDGSDMSDAEWDHIGRQLNPEDWPELRGTGYVPGQSLFWLKKENYPHWVKNEASSST